MKRCVLLGDMHVGSIYALAEPAKSGKKDHGSVIREILYSEWVKATQGSWKNPDILIANGDLIEGSNHKGKGRNLWSSELEEQCWHAIELLEMWGAKEYIILRGSDYHVQNDLHCEELIARELKAKEFPGQEHLDVRHRKRSGYHCYLTIEQFRMHIQHHVAVSRVFHYKPTPLARETLYVKLADDFVSTVSEQLRRTSLVVRSHVHSYLAIEFPSSKAMTLPAWKFYDDHLQTRSPLSNEPTLGFVGLTIEGEDVTYDRQTFKIRGQKRVPEFAIG